LAGGHLEAISPWHFTSKKLSKRLLYGVRPTKRYVGNPSEIRDRMLINGQWWLGLGRNGPVQHGYSHPYFDHFFVRPPYHIHGTVVSICVPPMLLSIDLMCNSISPYHHISILLTPSRFLCLIDYIMMYQATT